MSHKQKYTPVRFSHLTGYSGVGSIVRGTEDKLMTVVDTRYWTDKYGDMSSTPIPLISCVIKSLELGVEELRIPPIAKEDSSKGIQGSYLKAVLFPTYAVCKKCGLLHRNPWEEEGVDFGSKVYCEKCKGILEQITWCTVSNEGYLDDVSWHAVCHKDSKNKCETDYQSNYLYIEIRGDGENTVKCEKCNSRHKYKGQKIGFINKQQPWIYDQNGFEQNGTARVFEVNDPRVYLPERVSAIVIPPESRASKTTVVGRLYSNSKKIREIERLSEIKNRVMREERKDDLLYELAEALRCSLDDIELALEKIEEGYPLYGKGCPDGELLENEYEAFETELDDVLDDEDFVTDHKSEMWDSMGKDLSGKLLSIVQMIDKHIVAKRLREIQVFKGFRRGERDDQSKEDKYIDKEQDERNLIPPDISGESRWLPAIELFGEGIFFTLDEEMLSKWENIDGVKKRADEIAQRYEESALQISKDLVITPRFILLHTLAHLIIRELESKAGYPAASLSERIYSSKENKKMAGILIYVTVADVVGSLGGIIESAEPITFLNILDGVFKHARWCSLDPVCSEHEGQGPGWLNRAACHACSLIPETSCCYGNVFLDRVFIKGNKELGIPNFLEFIEECNSA